VLSKFANVWRATKQLSAGFFLASNICSKSLKIAKIGDIKYFRLFPSRTSIGTSKSVQNVGWREVDFVLSALYHRWTLTAMILRITLEFLSIASQVIGVTFLLPNSESNWTMSGKYFSAVSPWLVSDKHL